jgi:hypothetical protein
MSVFYGFLFLIIFGVFLYYGYRDDFRRDRNGSIRTVLPLLLGLILLLFFYVFLPKYFETAGWKILFSVIITQFALWLKKKFPKPSDAPPQ